MFVSLACTFLSFFQAASVGNREIFVISEIELHEIRVGAELQVNGVSFLFRVRFSMRPCISIRGLVRPSIRLSVGNRWL